MNSDKYSLSGVYHQIQSNMFGKKEYLEMTNGFVRNKPVYLNLSDLDLLNSLSIILDFYKKIDFSDRFMIEIPGSKKENPINWTMYPQDACIEYCVNCNEYLIYGKDYDSHRGHHIEIGNQRHEWFRSTCYNCRNYSPKDVHIVHDSGIMCSSCDTMLHSNQSVDSLKIYSRPVIYNFNMYEWVPIHKNIMENRNPVSSLYTRKMLVNHSSDCIKLSLIDQECEREFEDQKGLFVNPEGLKAFYNDMFHIDNDKRCDDKRCDDHKGLIAFFLYKKIISKYNISNFVSDKIIKMFLERNIKKRKLIAMESIILSS